MRPSIYDISQYDNITVDTYEILAAYFVDIFYNDLYAQAVNRKNNGDVESISQGYRVIVYGFVVGIDDSNRLYKAKNYNNVLKHIYESYNNYLPHRASNMAECIKNMVKEFVPSDYFDSLTRDQDRKILRSIIVNSVKHLTKHIMNDFIQFIIDNHDNEENCYLLKTTMVNILIDEREKWYHKFMKKSIAVDEKVDKSFVDKVRSEYNKLIEHNKKTVNELNLVKTDYKKKLDIMKALYNKCEELTEINKNQLIKNKKLDENISTLTTLNSQYKKNMEKIKDELTQSNITIQERDSVIDGLRQENNILKSINRAKNKTEKSTRPVYNERVDESNERAGGWNEPDNEQDEQDEESSKFDMGNSLSLDDY